MSDDARATLGPALVATAVIAGSWIWIYYHATDLSDTPQVLFYVPVVVAGMVVAWWGRRR